MIDIRPPPNKGLKAISSNSDKALFYKSLPVLAAKVPAASTAYVLDSPVMRKVLLRVPRVRSIEFDPADPKGDKLLLLRVLDESELPSDAREFLKPISTGLVTRQLKFDYDYWTADEILRSVLPDELLDGKPAGFAQVGHIAHLNLNAQYLPYKYLIGQVILDKNKSVKTVVNKVDTISDRFRVFPMELLAGEPDYVVQHMESNCRLTFDFTKVYFNPRLQSEHERLVMSFQPHEVVADVFAGVGPFTLPAAKKGCAVWANDLNPHGYEYLKKNVHDNKLANFVDVTRLDGRDFIRGVVRRSLEEPFVLLTGPRPTPKEQRKARQANKQRPSPLPETTHTSPQAGFRRRIDHFIMNLPDSAIEFLDAFRGTFREDEAYAERYGRSWEVKAVYDRMPLVHCYCFTREINDSKAKEDILERVAQSLGRRLRLEEDEVKFYSVRSVAPMKNMWCITFRLPRKVGFAES